MEPTYWWRAIGSHDVVTGRFLVSGEGALAWATGGNMCVGTGGGWRGLGREVSRGREHKEQGELGMVGDGDSGNGSQGLVT